MTHEEHIKRHCKLHDAMDELTADFITQTGKRPSETTIMELLEWSYKQTTNPTSLEPRHICEKEIKQ